MNKFNRFYNDPEDLQNALQDVTTPDELSSLYCANASTIENYPWLKREFIAAELRVSGGKCPTTSEGGVPGKCPTTSEGWEGGTDYSF